MNLLRCCQESVDGKNSLMDRDYVENLSARQKVSWWIEKLLRSYRDKVQKARWIEYAIRSIEKRSPRGSIDRNLSRICQEAVELDKKEFFKERKNTKRWMQTSKLLKHRSNQHVKLSKTSLNKNNAKHS